MVSLACNGPSSKVISDPKIISLSPINSPVAATISTPPSRDLYSLAERLISGYPNLIDKSINSKDISVIEGQQDKFNVVDLVTLRSSTILANLVKVSEHAYWYVEQGLYISSDDISNVANIFENSIYPSSIKSFGTLWNPEQTNNTHISILHTKLNGMAGYYSSADEYPKQVHSKSNERKMIYMDIKNLSSNTQNYLSTLTHELQHAIHWNADPGEETWVNEGLSELASLIIGYQPGFISVFLNNPQTSLTIWPTNPHSAAAHYGASALFFSYLFKHYGDNETIEDFIKDPHDGIDGVNSYLFNQGYSLTFLDVFRTWVAANYINSSGGIYSNFTRHNNVKTLATINKNKQFKGKVAQFATDYINLNLAEGETLIKFKGDTKTSVIPVEPHSGKYCWWGNRGDSINSTLTHHFDLTQLDIATLQFWTWYEIEALWDYAYVEVSEDNGKTWKILAGQYTSPKNPTGNSYGPGLTGNTRIWIKETMDLTPFAGKNILLRFEYVTDDAVNLPGLCIDDISIPELNYLDNVELEEDWKVAGFIRLNNLLSQTYIVQIIEKSSPPTITQIILDDQQEGEFIFTSSNFKGTNTVLAISPTARHTSEKASYRISLIELK